MSNPGGGGALPSSRITRILQEKAEALKKKRQSAEAVLKDVDERLSFLERLGIVPPEALERQQKIRDLARRSDWDAVETEANALLDLLAQTVPATIEDRRQRTADGLGRLSGIGVPIPADVTAELESLAHPAPGTPWMQIVERLAQVEDGLRAGEAAYVVGARDRALALARWADLPPDRIQGFDARLQTALLPAKEGRLAEAMDALSRAVAEGLPEAAQRRGVSRAAADQLLASAKEYGAPTGRLEAALRNDSESSPERWPETVGEIEAAGEELAGTLRERCAQALEALRSSLAATVDYGVDPTTAREAVESAIARLPSAPPLEIAGILADARRAAEEPIVSVVAGLLDEVRPRIAEARRLGRDPTDVFAAMTRAREAMRLKIYSEALAASQEALERVSQLTEDLDGARDELGSVEEMLRRFRAAGFASETFDTSIARARTHVERAEVGPAREVLRETVVHLGRDALQFYRQHAAALDRIREYARERGFLTDTADRDLTEAHRLLEESELVEGAERVAKAEVALRTAAAPYIARRVEEMQQGLTDIPDEALTAPVRRLLADADISLRVKNDLAASIESLRRAERDFAAVFAAHASALVELLETEGRILETMGGASDEVQRQIDEVQQIFNMGDFVKASRASQEIRTRAQQQQLLRSEEAVSHAKLSLVELETMGLDLSKFRGPLEDAQTAARGGQYLDAYRIASRLEEQASRARGAAQSVLEGISHAQELLSRLRAQGTDPTPFYEPLRNARLAFQALDFDGARTLVDGVTQSLGTEEARLDADRLLTEIRLLIEDGRRLSAPMEAFQHRLQELETERTTAPPAATRTAARQVHEELIAVVRPILEENLRALERDLDIARAARVQVDKILAPLSEARRRIALPLPVGAATLLDTARSEFVATRGFVEHADRVAKRAREALAEAELLHVDVAGLRAQVERIDELLAQRQYARAIELGSPLEREILQVTYQHVSKTLAGFQATVTRLRREGSNTSIAENLLHQARMALDEGRSVEAVQLAAKSESELERVELQRRLAQGSLQATERALARATEDGIVSAAAVDELARAKTAFEGHTYPEVLAQTIAASDTLEVARDGHRRWKDAYAVAERQLAESTELGASAPDASERLAGSRHRAESGQYSEAVREARESTEMGRWAIERLFTGPLADLRRQVESTRAEGLGAEIDPLESLVAEAESALRSREWGQVRDSLARASSSSGRLFESIVEGRWREVESEHLLVGPSTPAETDRREEVRRELARLREKGDFAAALRLVKSEADIARRRRQEELLGRMNAFKERLWVGERLGVDTTPVMQTFSEARVALDAGRVNEAEALLRRAVEALEPAVQAPFARRLKDLVTEVTFAQEGLHVNVQAIRERLRVVEEMSASGKPLDAGRLLLQAEEELNLRKSLHRELTNLHYLIDAALSRAQERHIDTTDARRLLAESLQLRETDYAAALEKAREALRKLQAVGVTTPPAPEAPVAAPPPTAPTTYSLFRRPPTEP